LRVLRYIVLLFPEFSRAEVHKVVADRSADVQKVKFEYLHVRRPDQAVTDTNFGFALASYEPLPKRSMLVGGTLRREKSHGGPENRALARVERDLIE
jgi:hypothetical protein